MTKKNPNPNPAPPKPKKKKPPPVPGQIGGTPRHPAGGQIFKENTLGQLGHDFAQIPTLLQHWATASQNRQASGMNPIPNPISDAIVAKNQADFRPKKLPPKPDPATDSGGGPTLHPFGGKDPMTNKPWAPLSSSDLANQKANVQDYLAHPVNEPGPFGLSGALLPKEPTVMTNKEYDTLRKAASKGNKRAQQILDKYRYKAVGYPTLQQDLMGKPATPGSPAVEGVLTPFTKQITDTLPQQATAIQNITNNALNQTTVPVSTAQVNADLAAMGGVGGVTSMPTPDAGTQNYENQLNAAMQSIPTFSTPNPGGIPGVPSMTQAIKEMGTAAKQSDLATPDETLLNALLQRAQTNLVYYGITPANVGGTTTSYPDYINQLLSQVQNAGAATANAAALGSIQQAAAGSGANPQGTQASTNISNPAQ